MRFSYFKFIGVLAIFLLHLTLQAQVPSRLLMQEAPPKKLSQAAQALVDAETRFNMVANRSNKPFWIEHLEIPLAALGKLSSKGLDPKIRDSLIFKKNGVDTVRWVLNPEDTKYGLEMESLLKAQGLDATRKRYFIGYLTASRSCIVQDPVSGVIFSIKSSTNVTGGNWRDKKMEAREAEETDAMNDYLMSNFKASENSALRLVAEPLGFTFAPANQSISIRQYDAFNSKTGRFLVPLFSTLHETFGAEIARKQGRLPEEFWAHAAIERTSIALAELGLNYGLIPDSAHGQNFLVEFNREGTPTGKIYVRDFVDSYLVQPLVAAQGGKRVIDLYKANEPEYLLTNRLNGYFGPFHGSRPPSWVSSPDKYMKRFHKAYTATAERILNGKQLTALAVGPNGLYGNWSGGGTPDSYYTATLDVKNNRRFQQLIAQRTPRATAECNSIFEKAQ